MCVCQSPSNITKYGGRKCIVREMPLSTYHTLSNDGLKDCVCGYGINEACFYVFSI